MYTYTKSIKVRDHLTSKQRKIFDEKMKAIISKLNKKYEVYDMFTHA